MAHLLKIIVLSPLLGLGIAIRCAPYLILFVAGVWGIQQVSLSDELVQPITDLVNLKPREQPETTERTKLVLSLMFLMYLFVLLNYRTNRSAAAQIGLTPPRSITSLLIPKLRYFYAGVEAWMLPILVMLLALGLSDGMPLGHRLGEPVLLVEDGKAALNDTAPLIIAIGIAGLLYFPLAGAGGVRTAAGIWRPSMWFSGAIPLAIVVLPYLYLSFMIVNLCLLTLAPFSLEAELTRGLYFAAVFGLFWSMMAAAAARVSRRSFARSMAKNYVGQISVQQMEELLPDLLKLYRQSERAA